MGRRHLARACVARPTPRLTGTFRATWAQTALGRSFEKAQGLPCGLSGGGSTCRGRRCGFDPRVGEIPPCATEQLSLHATMEPALCSRGCLRQLEGRPCTPTRTSTAKNKREAEHRLSPGKPGPEAGGLASLGPAPLPWEGVRL